MKSKTHIKFLSLMLVVVVSISTAIANEGSCLLKIFAANDLAKTASIYLDGKLEGTLESGELTIFDLDIGNHIITLDGELIEKHELEVVFQSTYESKRVDLEANPGKRAVRITSEPSNAAIRIDNEWLEQKTPWQITLEVGRTYEIELFKELHGSKTQSLLVPRKGEIIFLHAEIPKADPPKKPLLLYPEDKSVHLEERVVELAWESLDDSLQFEIEFDGKGHTTSNNIARFYSLERGKTYFWRVTAVNRYGMKTTSEQYSFTMQPNRLPEITSVYPKNESSDVFADVITLTWEVTDADGDRVTYDVYFGDVFDSLVKVRSNSTLNEHKLQELERGKTYYWKIVAFDSFGAKGEGSLNTFTTIANIPPVIDSSSEVLLKETDRDVLAELKWFCEDPDNKLLLYDVYLGVDKAPSLILSDHYLTTLTKEKLKFGTTYYWQIVARDGHGGISKGPLWEFTTKNPPSYIPSDIVPKMVFVEKGSFTMGDTDGANNEKPIHKVTLTYDFYIGKYETTFDEYDAFCEATGRSRPARDEGWGRGSRPVMNVNWWDAVAYCNWLSEKEDLPKAYDNNGNLLDKDGRITTDPSKVVGYRLPTEAEWEYAARGGNKSKEYKYSGSDNVDEVAWYYSNSGDSTQEVWKKAPNELGIYDMSGNVDEWCSDWYDWWYSSSAQTNPYKSTDGSRRVNRGGSWRYDASYVADRYGDSPTDASSRLGFRIARTVPYEGGNRPPLAPYNPIPSNEANIWTTSVTLSWDSYDPDDDVMTYDVYFDTNANLMTRVSSNQVVNTLNRSNLSYNTTYYWKVVAKDSKVVATEGPVWRFSIQEPPHPTMILVEKGSFEMGDTWGYGASNEKPTHKVTFTYNFYIGKYETTFDEYDAFCETTSRNKPDDEGWGRGIRPVINVSRNDAIAYCNWLSEKEDLPKAYDSNGNLLDKDGNITTDPSKVVGYRLPTEAEWEYASRGGNKSKGYKYFSGSDNVDDVAWYYSNSGSKTQEVGKKAPNELGIYDMSGNAWEWCSDGWYNYTGAPKTNPYNSTAGSYWVIRGGSCYDIATSTRVAYRGRISPSVTFALGFRICRTVPYEGGNRPPLAPYNPIPSDEAVVWATGITLRWDSYEPDDDTMTYDVYFDTNINPTTQVSSNQSETYFSIEALSYNTTYYWKVVAKDNKGGITEGPVWSFKTANPSHKVFSITYALFSSGIEKVKLVAGSHEIVSSGQRAELEVDWPLDFDTVSIWAVLEDSAEFIGAARVTASSSSRNIPVVSEDGSTKGVIRIELE